MLLCVVNEAHSKPPTVKSHQPTPDYRYNAVERHPPEVGDPSFETGVLEALRAIASQQKAARTEDQINEKTVVATVAQLGNRLRYCRLRYRGDFSVGLHPTPSDAR